jgi:dTDP-4-amino-4,6-dideoxygalactose transaminase
MDEIKRIARHRNLIVIEDAAHALGAIYKGKKIGGLSDLTILSFHPVKHITTGEGGMILTNNRNYYNRLLMFRTHGITKEKSLLTKDEGYWYYEMHHLGYNYRMTDFQCALGMSQLKRLPHFLNQRRVIAEKYNAAFKGLEEITIPYQNPSVKSAWHLYIIRLNLDRLNATRRKIFDALRHKNIGVNVHYIPVYYHPYYRKLGYKKGICPNAERYYEEAITLPLFPKMTDSDVAYAIKTVKKIINSYKK